MHLLRLFDAGCFTRPDRPYRLISNHNLTDAMTIGMNDCGKLTLDNLFGFPSFALCQRLSHANNRRQPACQSTLRFGCNHRIGFSMVLTTLRVPNQQITHAELF